MALLTIASPGQLADIMKMRSVQMNISIQDLPENVVANYEAAARSRGISLDVLLREYLIENSPSSSPVSLSPDEWEKSLDECFDSFPTDNPLPEEAFDRENIYGREDKW
jgi:hypothetical protein